MEGSVIKVVVLTVFRVDALSLVLRETGRKFSSVSEGQEVQSALECTGEKREFCKLWIQCGRRLCGVIWKCLPVLVWPDLGWDFVSPSK